MIDTKPNGRRVLLQPSTTGPSRDVQGICATSATVEHLAYFVSNQILLYQSAPVGPYSTAPPDLAIVCKVARMLEQKTVRWRQL
jgi:hypothetical protein